MEDQQLFATWIIFAVFALCVDIGVYIALRAMWQRNGVVLTDQFWDIVGDRIERAISAVIDWFPHIHLQLLQIPAPTQARPAPLPAAPQETNATSEKTPDMTQDELPAGTELVPFYVQTIGTIRQVQFSLEMPLNTTVNVRIGASGESGIKVEKREL